MSEIVFVERDPQGNIIGVYAVRQEGYAEEEIADDVAEVITFRARTAIKVITPDA